MHNGQFVKTEGYCTNLFFGHAIEWMDEKLDKGIPFFAYITPNAAHGPLQCPEGYEEHWAGKVAPDVAKFYGMLENIDDNFGHMLEKLDEWGISKDARDLSRHRQRRHRGREGVQRGNARREGDAISGRNARAGVFRWPAKICGWT